MLGRLYATRCDTRPVRLTLRALRTEIVAGSDGSWRIGGGEVVMAWNPAVVLRCDSFTVVSGETEIDRDSATFFNPTGRSWLECE